MTDRNRRNSGRPPRRDAPAGDRSGKARGATKPGAGAKGAARPSRAQPGPRPSKADFDRDGKQGPARSARKRSGDRSAGQESSGQESSGHKSSGQKNAREKRSWEKSAGNKSSGEKTPGHKRSGPNRQGRRDPANDRPGPGAGAESRAVASPKPDRKPSKPESGVWIYGRHAVAAALANPLRKIRRVAATLSAAEWLAATGADTALLARLEDLKPDAIDRLLPEGAVHQGLALLTAELPRARLKDVCAPAEPGRPVLVLDQITDPQNIGALFRVAAAFGARAVIVQERRTPPLAGALAKAAAGAVEIVPCVDVVNIARALEALKNLGYHCGGLAGEASADIAALPDAPLALVMGAEGAGLRQLVAATCDALYRIPIAAAMESLNVSTAAAIALYEGRRKG